MSNVVIEVNEDFFTDHFPAVVEYMDFNVSQEECDEIVRIDDEVSEAIYSKAESITFNIKRSEL